MAYLDDHPPARQQFRHPRREPVSGVVVLHTAENTPDAVATDGGAEAVANFIRTRSDAGSYHDLCDSDSCINLVHYDAEAYHDATGSNRHSYGVSVATRADWWPLAPKAWRDGAIRQAAHAAARYARWVKATRGITIPARRINRAQSEARMPGFISHAERDPARRHDPGAAFPWTQFLDEYARAMGTTTGDDDMPLTDDDVEKIATKVRLVLNEGTGGGQSTWAGTSKATLSTVQAAINKLNAIAGAVAQIDIGDDVDEAQLAALILAGLSAEAIADALDDGIAAEVADLLSVRLAG